MSEEIDRKLADMHYVDGMSAYSARDYAAAFREFSTALGRLPSHTAAQRRLEDLAGKAKELFEEGYRLKDSEPAAAREKWRLVMRIVPAGHEYHKKARQWLDSLP
jgi:hypothetical protein